MYNLICKFHCPYCDKDVDYVEAVEWVKQTRRYCIANGAIVFDEPEFEDSYVDAVYLPCCGRAYFDDVIKLVVCYIELGVRIFLIFDNRYGVDFTKGFYVMDHEG